MIRNFFREYLDIDSCAAFLLIGVMLGAIHVIIIWLGAPDRELVFESSECSLKPLDITIKDTSDMDFKITCPSGGTNYVHLESGHQYLNHWIFTPDQKFTCKGWDALLSTNWRECDLNSGEL